MSTTSSSEYGDDLKSSSCSSDGGPYQYYGNHHTSIQVIDKETETHHSFKVSFYNNPIQTTVTHTAYIVNRWIGDVYASYARYIENHNLIVGLDIEWVRLREISRNKVAVLQLCLAHRCLIFQLFGRDKEQLPESLFDFLRDERIRFVGAGIDQDAYKLWVDYGLTVARTEDLAGLAAYKLGGERLHRAGLKSLIWHVLGKDLAKHRMITLSRWDVDFLTDEQVEYACLDAYASFRLGFYLIGCPAPANMGYTQKTNQDQGFKICRPAPAPLTNEGFNRYPREDIKKSASKETNQDQVVKATNQVQGVRLSEAKASQRADDKMDKHIELLEKSQAQKVAKYETGEEYLKKHMENSTILAQTQQREMDLKILRQNLNEVAEWEKPLYKLWRNEILVRNGLRPIP
ncbi:hypothetical protein MKX03_022611 [Papaver bracteatum]|nr:hypothetical protein MKX03_022611 [Papaver bracteatum]